MTDRVDAAEACRRAIAITDEMFPAHFKPTTPDLVRISIGLLARCMTSAEACLHLAQLGRRSDLMVCVRTLYEHTVMFGWLTGTDEGERRMLLWERYCDEQALRMDDEVARLGGEASIPAGTRNQMSEAAARLGVDRLPSLPERAAAVDREWADRLGLDPAHRDYCSLRRTYSIVFRVGSAMAHPTLAGVRLVTDRTDSAITIGLEPSGGANAALLPVPALLMTALAVSAHALGKPSAQEVNKYIDWLLSHLE
jgi:hypothetical protein